jgi:type VI secretion system protein ImpE
MPDIETLIKTADLAAALAAANQAVRENPAEPKHRLLLAQLNCVLGRWEKARDQFSLFTNLTTNPDSRLRARLALLSVQCEVFRAEVFAGKRTPLLFGEPAPWLGFLTQSLRLLAEGKNEAAAQLRDQAFEEAPATAGKLDGQPFEWLADADTRLGPVLELYMEGKYYWVPFNRIQRIAFDAPADLCDLVFIPAQFKWTNGGDGAGFVPVRYASHLEVSADPKIALSRLTDWRELPGPFAVGSGQRLFATDTGETPLLEAKIIDFIETK